MHELQRFSSECLNINNREIWGLQWQNIMLQGDVLQLGDSLVSPGYQSYFSVCFILHNIWSFLGMNNQTVFLQLKELYQNQLTVGHK